MSRNHTFRAVFALVVAASVAFSCDWAFAGRGGRGGGGGGRMGGGRISGSRMSGGQFQRMSTQRRSSGQSRGFTNHRNAFAKNTNGKRGDARNHHHHRRGYFGYDGAEGVGGVGYVDGVAALGVQLPITLLNSAGVGQPVNYTLGQAGYSIEPSSSMVHNDGTQVIAFDRGGDFGQAAYTLQPGTYRFIMTDQGLDLRTVTSQVTADQVASGYDASDE